MSYYAVICLNGEELCVVHYNGYLGKQGTILYNIVNEKFKYTWNDVLTESKNNTIVYINLKYVRLTYDFCYNIVKHGYNNLDWPYPPTPEFLKEGTGEDVDAPVTTEWGWGGNNDYYYNLVGNKLFVKLPHPWFPWVLVDESLLFDYDESLLNDILCEIYGVLNITEIDRDSIKIDRKLYNKVIEEGPQTNGIRLLRECKKAVELIPDDLYGWWNYSEVLNTWRKKDEALDAVKKVLELAPKNNWRRYAIKRLEERYKVDDLRKLRIDLK
ncbi:hypothetical protein LCGC14_1087210 [marine sediment metagenome]|uniref:Uncharacterized protein n=1 Tax=marine sediment metagenome TaxID=412755 RepID=A0A0F9MHU8_9ZZZZ